MMIQNSRRVSYPQKGMARSHTTRSKSLDCRDVRYGSEADLTASGGLSAPPPRADIGAAEHL